MEPFSLLQLLILWGVPVLFAITLHEVAHGWVAYKLGDKTALMLGRLSLNPIKHIDPLGTVLVPITLFLLGGFIFGWAKPVPVTQANLRSKRRDMAIVALAGPVSNLLMAVLWGLIAKIAMLASHYHWPLPATLLKVLFYMGQFGIIVNLLLATLNLLPILPLDGGRMLANLLPPRISMYYERTEPYGLFILIGLLALGGLSHILSPPLRFLHSLIGHLLGI